MVAYLIEKKANRTLRNKAGERPADVAKSRGQDAVLELLSKR